MNKTIWFINDYAGSSYYGMEFRNYYFAKEFVKKGYKVYIISASYMHLFKKLPKINGNYTFEKIDGINYVWVKVPKYSSSTDKKRVLKWFAFTLKLFFLPFSKMKKPDVVIASPMATFLNFSAYKIAKKYNAKFFYEVKDIWPLSIVELGNINSSNLLIKLMSWCEKFAIKRADNIISSLQNYDDNLKNDLNTNKEFNWICNGIDLDEFKDIKPLNIDTKKHIPSNKFIVGYTGTIGIANSIESFCKAAKHLKDNKDIVFIIVGDGKEKNNLIKRYGNLHNLIFIDAIPKEQVQSILTLFDVCYIGLKKKNLFKYGVSPNKLFDYMYSAKPIIYAIDSGKENIVKVANCGVCVEAENFESIANGVKKLYNMTKENREKLGINGKLYVLEHFTYKKLAQKYIKIIEG